MEHEAVKGALPSIPTGAVDGAETAGVAGAGLVVVGASAGVDPIEHLTDVLDRISSHPQHDIDALLPDRWRPADTA